MHTYIVSIRGFNYETSEFLMILSDRKREESVMKIFIWSFETACIG